MPFTKRSSVHQVTCKCAAILYVTIAAEIHLHLMARGLEPGCFFHEPAFRKHALALDLLEPFRAPLADALTLDLINHRRIRLEHFESKNGGWYLKPENSKIAIQALEQRLSQEFFHNQEEHRTNLRQAIIRQVVSTLAFIEGKSNFVPFHMN